jgi:hypothetical protein
MGLFLCRVLLFDAIGFITNLIGIYAKGMNSADVVDAFGESTNALRRAFALNRPLNPALWADMGLTHAGRRPLPILYPTLPSSCPAPGECLSGRVDAVPPAFDLEEQQ